MRLRFLIGATAAGLPGKLLDHNLPDAFDRDEEAERRAARSLLRRHRSVFLPDKKHPRF